MSDRIPDPPRKEQARTDFNDPDAENAEQNEAGSQAQDVAADAANPSADLAEESEHGGRRDPARLIADDVEDLVDKQNAMLRSGRIDMDAFAGEEDMDDTPPDE